MTACGMPLAHRSGAHAVTAMHSVPDDAWYLELDPAAGQQNLVTVIIPDEDPAWESTVCFAPQEPHLDVPV